MINCRRRIAVAIVLVFSLVGCAAGTPPPPASPVLERTEQGMKFAGWLALTDRQQQRLIKLVEEVDQVVEPLRWEAEELMRAFAATARRCRNDSTYLQMCAESLVAAGEVAREPMLDAINELHAILTPAQRRALASHLLERERGSTPDRRDDASQDTTKQLSIDLDLSLVQIARILFHLRRVQGIYEDRAEPWLTSYRIAVEGFMRADFDIRNYQLAKVPLIELGTGFMRDLYRGLIPMLEPEQCRVISEKMVAWLDKMHEEQKEKERKGAKSQEGGEPDDSSAAPSEAEQPADD